MKLMMIVIVFETLGSIFFLKMVMDLRSMIYTFFLFLTKLILTFNLKLNLTLNYSCLGAVDLIDELMSADGEHLKTWLEQSITV